MSKSVYLAAGLCLLTSALAVGQSAQQRRYLALGEATLRRPITPAELEAAVLSGAGVATIENLFERSMNESLSLDGTLVTPELGGELLLDDGSLDFVVYPDRLHDVLREMVTLKANPGKLLEILQSSPEGQRILSETGGLHALLYMMTRDESPTRDQVDLLENVVRGAVSTHFKTWTVEPDMQAEMIEATEWHGRYVGFWHIHPPRWAADGFAEGIEPSVADMTNATQLGQFVTVVFQPDGFDFYDLSGLAGAAGPNLSKTRVFRYRSEGWLARFRERAHSKHSDPTHRR